MKTHFETCFVTLTLELMNMNMWIWNPNQLVSRL